jgi:hypothetical protein
MSARNACIAAAVIAAGPVHAAEQSAAQPASPSDFILEFATKSTLGQGGDVVSGYFLLCSRGTCSLTLTGTSANACTGAAPRVPSFVRSFEYNSKEGNLDISRLSADSVQIRFTWTWELTELTSVLTITYKVDGSQGPGLTKKTVTKIGGGTYPANGRGAYDYKLIPGPVSCEIEFSG